MAIKSGQIIPALDLPLVGGGRFVHGNHRPGSFTVLVFYRGLHCQRCPGQLRSYQDLLPSFREAGAEVIAITSDDKDRATKSAADWGIDRLPMAYGFSLEAAQVWGIHITSGNKPEDPELFTEPATFVVKKDGKLDIGVVNSGPRLRPEAADVLAHIQDRLADAGKTSPA
jgi:peroxiredoxin